MLAIVPLFIFLYFYLQDEAKHKTFTSERLAKYRSRLRVFFLFSRSLIFFLLLIALSLPYTYDTHTVSGDPRVHILADASDSFTLFDANVAPTLRDALTERVRVEYNPVGFATVSDLGDGVLSHLREHDNLLLVSDGYTTSGSSLEDIATYATSLNATISAVQLVADEYDAAVRVVGPGKTTANVENTFGIFVDESLDRGVAAPTVTLDGMPVALRAVDSGWQFSATFSSGYHEIVATLPVQDTFASNNVFYKTVKVVPKPKVGLYSLGTSPLVELFSPIYDLVELESLDALDPYTALVVSNTPAALVDPSVSSVSSFVADGNGLVVFGGPQAYDASDYKGSVFEQVLPVYVAQAGKKQGDINIVVVMDISGSTGSLVAGDKAVDVEKAIALGVLSDIGVLNRVGFIAFNTVPYTIAEMKMLLEQVDLVDDVAALSDLGGTKIDVGIMAGVEMLSSVSGDKNIILISDGKTQGYDEALRAAARAADAGVRIYTIGVGGRTNDDVMQRIADYGHGAYFKAAEKERIKLLFGDPDDSGAAVQHLTVLNEHHFITQDLGDISAAVYGFNTVVPKAAAHLLLTTSQGDPALTVWRYGLGRVASFTLDDGTAYAPEILSRGNSQVLTRMVNWAIGDPERKNEYFVDISDAAVGDTITVRVKSSSQPVSDSVSFVKFADNLYEGVLVAEDVGFHTLLGATYAINGPTEYKRVGFNKDLSRIVEGTGGHMFDPADVDGIEVFLRSASQKAVYERTYYAWPFLLLALIVYLIEIFIRRSFRNRLR